MQPRIVIPSTMLVGMALVIASCEPEVQRASSSRGSLEGGDFLLAPVVDTVFRVGTGVDEEDQFVRVASVAFDDSGNLYALDVDRHRLSAWNRSGNRLWAMGRPGDGPEEFRRPRLALVFPEGVTAVYDQGHRAFTVIDGEGRYQRSVRATRGPLPGERAASVGGGRWIGPDEPWTSTGSTTAETVPLFAFSFAQDAVEADTFFHAWRPPLSANESPRGYRPRALLAGFSDGRAALVDSVGYRVKILAQDGSVTRVLERPISPLPVTEAAMEAARMREVARISEREISRTLGDIADVFPIQFDDVDMSALIEDYRADVAEMAFHEEIPVINKLAVDWDNRIWATRSDATGGEEGGTDVITPAGEYLGTLRFEDVASPRALGPDGLMAYLETDALGVQTVLVVRLLSLGIP